MFLVHHLIDRVQMLRNEGSNAMQVDAMSDAVDNADAMLSCISLAYKESASEVPSQLHSCFLW